MFSKAYGFKVLVRYYWIKDYRQGHTTRIEIKYIELLGTGLYYLNETQNSNDNVLNIVLLISSRVFYPPYLSFKKTFN